MKNLNKNMYILNRFETNCGESMIPFHVFGVYAGIIETTMRFTRIEGHPPKLTGKTRSFEPMRVDFP